MPPSLAEVARRVGLSSGALSKRFIAELGVNPRDWLVARKRQRFRKALRAGETVADALYGAGYGSPRPLYETSYQALGLTPPTHAKGGPPPPTHFPPRASHNGPAPRPL